MKAYIQIYLLATLAIALLVVAQSSNATLGKYRVMKFGDIP